MKINKRDCRNCKHFFVCAYTRRYDYHLDDLLECIRKPEVKGNDKVRALIYEFLAKSCQYFNQDCYSKEGQTAKTKSNKS